LNLLVAEKIADLFITAEDYLLQKIT